MNLKLSDKIQEDALRQFELILEIGNALENNQFDQVALKLIKLAADINETAPDHLRLALMLETKGMHA